MDEAGQELQGGGLAGPVRAEETEDLSGLHLKAQVVQDPDAAAPESRSVVLGQPLSPNGNATHVSIP
jgi:hypothetical protein